MKTAQNNVKEFITDFLTPFLKENRYKKSGILYYKPVNGFSFIIEMQSSLFNSKEETQFTFNVSLYVHHYRYLNNTEPPKCPTKHS
ncbi:DUF4304 domain-containing protein [Brevibacillus sp. SYSU BS000544]|uniref:DUF4304 domain-containing protein n=1 Tax=Brevibacillus sp. SYSU BS000544 TaxID=3416443 RepID=UPI003CE493AC